MRQQETRGIAVELGDWLDAFNLAAGGAHRYELRVVYVQLGFAVLLGEGEFGAGGRVCRVQQFKLECIEKSLKKDEFKVQKQKFSRLKLQRDLFRVSNLTINRVRIQTFSD